MKVMVWDTPTRIFHWSLAVVCATAYITSRSEYYQEVHATAGYTALGLVFFRVLWGFFGNRYARFREFLKGWKDVRSYLSRFIAGRPPRYLGHNPAVGWVVVVMLGLMAVIASAGVVTYSAEESKGVFAGLFSFTTGVYAHGAHRLLAYGFIFIIVTHVCAALIHDFYFKENIIASMVTGKKDDPETWRECFEDVLPTGAARVARLVALVLLSMVGGWALFFFTLAGRRDLAALRPVKVLGEEGIAVEFVPNETWQDECGEACHSQFHPTLLPAESWKMVVANLGEHFGDDASLDEDATAEILDFLVSNSAERSSTEASRKILWSLKPGSTPSRITETPYWRKKHSGIKEGVFARDPIFSRSNCAACHRDAATGWFDDAYITIPKPEKGGNKKP